MFIYLVDVRIRGNRTWDEYIFKHEHELSDAVILKQMNDFHTNPVAAIRIKKYNTEYLLDIMVREHAV